MDPIVRLSQADPAPGGYVPADLEAMVSRVTRQRVRRDPFWWRLRLGVGGALAATSVATGLAVATLGSLGPALPVFAFSADAHKVQGAAALNVAAQGAYTALRPEVTWNITAGVAFSTASGTGIAYDLAAPADPAVALASVATTLGVDFGAPTTKSDATSATSQGPTFAGWLVDQSGYATWGVDHSYASSPPTLAPETAQGGAGSASGETTTSSAIRYSAAPVGLVARAVGYAQALVTTGVDVGAPSATSDSLGDTSVTVPLSVGGLATDFSDTFNFAADGSLLNASGVMADLSAGPSYPLISPAAGVDQILPQLTLTTTYVAASSGGGVASSTPTYGSATTTGVGGSSPGQAPPGTPSPGDSTTTTVEAVPTSVTLTAVEERYGVFVLKGGTTALLPVYVYTGTVGSGDASYQVSFRVVAVDPRYLDLSTLSAG
jgi:hypothetical protein